MTNLCWTSCRKKLQGIVQDLLKSDMIKWKRKNRITVWQSFKDGVMIWGVWLFGFKANIWFRSAHTTSVSNPSNPIVFSRRCATAVDGSLVVCSPKMHWFYRMIHSDEKLKKTYFFQEYRRQTCPQCVCEHMPPLKKGKMTSDWRLFSLQCM